MTGTDSELLEERYGLVSERIREIGQEQAFSEPLASYFSYCASFLEMLFGILDRTLSGATKDMDTSALSAENHRLYEDIAGSAYDNSFTNPGYIVPLFGKAGITNAKELARYLSFLLVQIRGLIPYAYEGNKEILTIHAELFAEVCSLFRFCAMDGTYPEPSAVSDILYWFISDYCDTIIPDSKIGRAHV